MFNAIISWSLENRLLVVALWLGLAAIGVFALIHLPIDAFPDTTPIQVQINTVAPALTPQQVEQQITFPVEQSISGLPHLEEVRSVSKFGLSQVVVTFADGTDIITARNLINERLATVTLPPGTPRPVMGPIATGLGEVLHYAVTRADQSLPIGMLAGAVVAREVRIKEKNLMELRTIHDWTVKPSLRTVPGTAEINSWGGLEKQYQVRVDPNKLIQYGVTFEDIQQSLAASNITVGGGTLSHRGEALLVQGLGLTRSTQELGKIVVKASGGTPVLLNQIADIRIGHEIRRGAVTADGQGEVVLGLGFMLMGENSRDVTYRLKDKLSDIEKNLPPGTKIVKLYDRTELVDQVIKTVRNNLFEGGLLVIAILFIFLGNLRAGLIVALAIPCSMLFAFCGMWKFAIAGSLLSLGAIDFGLVVDSSVVLVENCMRRLSHRRGAEEEASRIEIIRDAAIEVRKPTLFGELIILIVYIPILTLDGVAGKMFRPMALTVVFALVGSLVASLTLIPVLASMFLPKHPKEKEPILVQAASVGVMPLFRLAWIYRLATLCLALVALLAAVMLSRSRGGQFVPTLSEGAFTLNVKRLAGVDVDEVVLRNTLMEQHLLKCFPDEIDHIWSRCGVAEVATDPMGVEETDTFISLKPRSQWKRATTQDELLQLIKAELNDIPGQIVAYSQPIEQRVNEMTSGVKGDLAIKIFGDDFQELDSICDQIERVLREINPGVKPTREQLEGSPLLKFELDLTEMARYELTARTVLDYIEAIGSKPAGDIYEQALRYPLIIRLAERWRTKEQVGQILIPTRSGEQVPLERVCKIRHLEGPAAISREWGQRVTVMQCNVESNDMTGFVAEARRRIQAEVRMPANGRYRIEWSGTYEYLEDANRRLAIVVPVVLLAILTLLYLSFNHLADALRIFTCVPFSVVGGVAALYFRDLPFSVSAAVGFIAVSGVSVLNGLLLVSFIRQLRDTGLDLTTATSQAVRIRLRPVLMTALVASLGFVPMAISTGVGAEVQRPLATVVIGGVISSTLMTLFILPVIYRVTTWQGPPAEPPSSHVEQL